MYQISVFLENRSGQLAEITQTLAEHNIDLRAIHIAESADYGVVRLIASDTEAASGILLEHGFILSRTPVLPVAVPDRVGGLAELLSVLAAEQVDIEYMYSLFGSRDGKAYMILRVNEPEAVAALLSNHGFAPATDAALGIQ